MKVIKLNEKNKIVKANKLIEAKFKLSVIESKLFLHIVSLVEKDDEDFKPYTFGARDLLEFFGMDKKDYKALKEATKKLVTRGIVINEVKKEIHVSLMSSAVYEDGTITLKFDPNLKPYLLQLKKGFTAYTLENVLKLNSFYSIRIYELLKQYQKIKRRVFSIEELKKTFDIKKEYPVYSNFKKRVILSSQKELKEKTDIRFEFEEIKQGKKVVEIEFFIYGNKSENQSDTEVSMDNNSAFEQEEVFQEILKKGFLPEQIFSFIDEFGFDRVERNFNYALEKEKLGKISDNFNGYFVEAVKGNWRPEKTEAEKLFERQEAERKKEKELRKAEELQKQKEDSIIEALKNLFFKARNERLSVFLKETSPDELSEYFNEFEKDIAESKEYLKLRYKKKGLDSTPVRLAFINFLFTKYPQKVGVLEEELEFLSYINKNSDYQVEELENNGVISYNFLNYSNSRQQSKITS